MSLINNFSLTRNEANLLFSIEYLITDLDISLSTEAEYKNEKRQWLTSWDKMLSKQGFTLSYKESKKEIIQQLSGLNPLKSKIILFEAFLFKPYFNIAVKATSGFGKGDQKEKSFTKESYSRMENLIKDITENVLKENKFLDLAKKEYEASLDKIPDDRIFSLRKKTFLTLAAAAAIAITGGIAAPAIGTIIGGIMGLSGAAATSAGLALLGGGAIAAGGGGMVAGTILIIGGGAILGGAAGNYLNNSLSENSPLILSQLAKLLAILKTLVDSNIKETYLNESLLGLKDLRKNIYEEIKFIEDGKKKIAKEKSLKYVNQAIKILQDYEEELYYPS